MAVPAFEQGAILVENGTTLPGAMSLRRNALSEDWRSVPKLDRSGLEAQLAEAGWTFFYMAGVVKKHAFGFDQEKRVRAAVGRVIKDVRSQNCNSLEITHLATKFFLGIPYASITAHARHIQDGCRFRSR
jgi:hypothetical protein